MKIRCPDCKNPFEITQNEYDDGDYLECPDCSLDLVVKVKKGKIKVVTDKEKYYDEEEAPEEFFEEEDE